MDEVAAEWGTVGEIVVKARLGAPVFNRIAPLLDPADRGTPLHIFAARRIASIAVLESLWRHGFDGGPELRDRLTDFYRKECEARDAALEQLQITGPM